MDGEAVHTVGYSPWGRKELDMTEQVHFTSLHFHYILCSMLTKHILLYTIHLVMVAIVL